MMITKLLAENFKRITAVQIEPDGSTVVVGGRNAQGKSSTLDAIEAALGGGKRLPSSPIRHGEKSARVVLETDSLTITRRFTPNGSALTVQAANGAKYPSPQKMLDELVGSLSFDPLEFARMPASKQAATLRAIAGIDTTSIDERRRAAYDERTVVNREINAVRARIAASSRHPDAPAEEISVADLSAELQRRHVVNNDARAAQRRLEEQYDHVRRMQQTVLDLERQLNDARGELQREVDKCKKLVAVVDSAIILKTDDLQELIANAESVNRKVRENQATSMLEAECATLEEKADALTAEIAKCDEDKAIAVAAAEFPVDGLGVDDGGVTYHGVPFEQSSQAEKIRVSVAIGLALNPGLRVLLIRDGSLLDSDNLQLVAKMASDADAQVWIERVGDGAECTVVIEDGAAC